MNDEPMRASSRHKRHRAENTLRSLVQSYPELSGVVDGLDVHARFPSQHSLADGFGTCGPCLQALGIPLGLLTLVLLGALSEYSLQRLLRCTIVAKAWSFGDLMAATYGRMGRNLRCACIIIAQHWHPHGVPAHYW